MTYAVRLGLVINAYAGLGGSVGLKGSDGAATVQEALARGAMPKAPERAAAALQLLQGREDILVITGAGSMGAAICEQLQLPYEVVYEPAAQAEVSGPATTAADTQAAVRAITAAGVDILVFAGGDGTARDICQVVPEQLPVLGIPAGVKIHSGVYAISPKAAGRVLEKLLNGELTTVRSADVMDIDETLFRSGQVRAMRYGDMLVPSELEYIQAVKMGGKESDELVLADIADDIREQIVDSDAHTLWIMGSGSTVAAIMESGGWPNTLLGVDVIRAGEVIASDVTASQLEQLLADAEEARLVITLIGGQGHIFGRGNQQLSPAVIRAVGKDNIQVVATKRKLQALGDKPLRVDTGDDELDTALSGFIRVVTGYHDAVLKSVVAVE